MKAVSQKKECSFLLDKFLLDKALSFTYIYYPSQANP